MKIPGATWRLLALIVGSFAILAISLLMAHEGPVHTIKSLIHGSLGSPAAISDTLRETTPLLICGLSVFIALRAGLFNIGVEGQLLAGAVAAAWLGLRVHGVLGIVVCVVAGMVAGALWALPAGLIRAYRNGHEVITTIMMNFIAGFLASALVAGPIKDPSHMDTSTIPLDKGTMIPMVYDKPPVQVSWALLLGIVVAVAMAIWLRRTVAGYELQAVGENRSAARFAGISPQKVTVFAMSISGALGGLAGAVQVLAYEGRFYDGFSPGYGFDALGVALLAGGSAYAVLPCSLLFGILSKGGTALQIDGVPKGITIAVLGFVILIAAAIRYRQVKANA